MNDVPQPIELEDGRTWHVPAYAVSIPDRATRCRSCDAEIVWIVTTNAKRMPVDQDGTSHFATCPEAEKWRRSR